jgi:hypothetical protein
VVKRLLFGWSSPSPFQSQLNPMLMMSCPDHSTVLAARKMSTKERPLDNFHRKVGSPCKSRTHIRLQDRVPIAYGDRRKSERFVRVRASHYFYTTFFGRSSRADSGFRDFWGGAGLVGVVITRFRVDGRHYAQMLLHSNRFSSGCHCVVWALFVGLSRRFRSSEFLEARIIPERIEHRIEPEQRGSKP